MNLLSLVIKTQRLTLRPLHTGDQEAVAATFGPDVRSQMTAAAVNRLSDTRAFLLNARQLLVRNAEWHAAIELKGGRLIGCVSLRALDTPLPSIGIWIAVEHRHAGLGKECVAATVSWARSNLMLEHVRYTTFVDNAPSVKLAQSLGGIASEQSQLEDSEGRVRLACEFWL